MLLTLISGALDAVWALRVQMTIKSSYQYMESETQKACSSLSV